MNEAFARRWGWLLALGIIQLVSGGLALALPVLASVAAAIFVGWLLLFSAAAHLLHAFQVRGWRGFVLHLLGALVYGAAGVLLIFNPLQGAASLTLVLAWLFIADGVIRGVLALRLRPADRWGWFLASAIVSFAVGIMLIAGWPASGLWALGTLLGINLIFSGVSYLFLGSACRRESRSPGLHPAAHAI
jgi:uncharacterized membrane protein HdeD (DUF308 family)